MSPPRILRPCVILGFGIIIGLYLITHEFNAIYSRSLLCGFKGTAQGESAHETERVGRLPHAFNYDVKSEHATSEKDPWHPDNFGDYVHGNDVKAMVQAEPEIQKTTKPPWLLNPKQMITDRNSTVQVWPWGNITDACDRKDLGDTSTFPRTSVIIAFHDHELLSNVLHTIHSILHRTPSHLLQEIILIDDNSKKDDFKEVLDNYVRNVFGSIVMVMRSPTPLGLIRARLLGTRIARGEVFVVMDSHMEVQHMWLEHLLYEIKKNPKTLAGCYLDWMEYKTDGGYWRYQHGASDWKTYFDWSFTFGFQSIPVALQMKRGADVTQPMKSPVTVGTIWAMNKAFFNDIGALDDQMQGWGGENLDITIRVWLFGGQVVNVPCSHAGHFESARSRDYRRTWDNQINRNYKRVAEVWLDEYKEVLYEYNPQIKSATPGDLSGRQSIRERAFHNFTWYLDNVFPELGIPSRDSIAWGGLFNLQTGSCVEIVGMGNPSIAHCRGIEKQAFYWAKTMELRLPVYIFNAQHSQRMGMLLTTAEYIPVSDRAFNSKWIHWRNGPLIETRTLLCLDSPLRYNLKLEICNFSSPSQRWRFGHYGAAYDELYSLPPEREVIEHKILHYVLLLEAQNKYKEAWETLRQRGGYMPKINQTIIDRIKLTLSSQNASQPINYNQAEGANWIKRERIMKNIGGKFQVVKGNIRTGAKTGAVNFSPNQYKHNPGYNPRNSEIRPADGREKTLFYGQKGNNAIKKLDLSHVVEET